LDQPPKAAENSHVCLCVYCVKKKYSNINFQFVGLINKSEKKAGIMTGQLNFKLLDPRSFKLLIDFQFSVTFAADLQD
jgi:hypothetical protein